VYVTLEDTSIRETFDANSLLQVKLTQVEVAQN
jgi:hypothetical protein